jgi:hypothetical protein
MKMTHLEVVPVREVEMMYFDIPVDEWDDPKHAINGVD